MTEIFKALSDETRLRILSVLMSREMCVCEIEDALELSQSNASRHLTTLKRAGIIAAEKHAQWTYFKIADAFIEDNGELYAYLSKKLKMLPSCEADLKRAAASKKEELCK